LTPSPNEALMQVFDILFGGGFLFGEITLTPTLSPRPLGKEEEDFGIMIRGFTNESRYQRFSYGEEKREHYH
jgi:hypothetical protein